MDRSVAFGVVVCASGDRPESKNRVGRVRRRGRVFRPKRYRNEGGDLRSSGLVDENGSPATPRPEGWFAEYSREFMAICLAQFEVLAQVLNASRCVLYLRRDQYTATTGPDESDEKPSESEVEFVPVCTYPESGDAWVVGAENQPRVGRFRLPGGIPASILVPEYPFLSLRSRVAEDGSLTVPVISGQDVIGILAIWRNDSLELSEPPPAWNGLLGWPISASQGAPADRMLKDEQTLQARTASTWSDQDIEQASRIANTLACACSLDQRTQQSERSQKEQLQNLAKLRSLLSSVLHQVRSPLGALVTFGKLLLRRLPVGDVSRDLARDIVVQSERMQDLLSPLDGSERVEQRSDRRLPASLSKRESATDISYIDLAPAAEKRLEQWEEDLAVTGIEVQTCWLGDIVEPVLNTASTMAAEASLRFLVYVAKDAPPCLVDEKAVTEVMHNVLDNAIAFTPSPGVVEVTVDSTNDDSHVFFKVRDTGYGIAEGEEERIFERGFRGTASEKARATILGQGLGLFLARKIVERMSGTITVTSPSGIGGTDPGTTVTVTFPRR